jgi:hypothetical protein
MNQADLDAAADLARAAVGAADDVPVETLPVRRLDRDASYVLVRLGRAGEPGWIAAVDPGTADVMTWAGNASGGSTVPAVDPGEMGMDAERELVWRPSAQSRSPLYPLLRWVTSEGERFVDLSGTVTTGLSDTRG